MDPILEELKKFLSESTPEKDPEIWREVDFYENVGPTISEFLAMQEETLEYFKKESHWKYLTEINESSDYNSSFFIPQNKKFNYEFS